MGIPLSFKVYWSNWLLSTDTLIVASQPPSTTTLGAKLTLKSPCCPGSSVREALREEKRNSSEPVMSKRQVAGMQPWFRSTNFFFDTRST